MEKNVLGSNYFDREVKLYVSQLTNENKLKV